MGYNLGATMASRIKQHIADTAIKLFADRGYHGVSTRDIAKLAKVTEGSIYRIFATKDGVFKEAVTTVLRQALDPAQFLLMIYENEDKKDRMALLTAAIMRWYSSLSPSAARLLTQAYFLEEWRDFAYGPINKIMEILSTTLQRSEGTSRTSKTDFVIAAHAPILALLQFKITYASSCSPKEENETVGAMVRQWLRTVLPSS
jgi:AcrR family transcriptional regulator